MEKNTSPRLNLEDPVRKCDKCGQFKHILCVNCDKDHELLLKKYQCSECNKYFYTTHNYMQEDKKICSRCSDHGGICNKKPTCFKKDKMDLRRAVKMCPTCNKMRHDKCEKCDKEHKIVEKKTTCVKCNKQFSIIIHYNGEHDIMCLPCKCYSYLFGGKIKIDRKDLIIQ